MCWGVIMFFESAVISHIGYVRKNNEDNYYLNGVYRSDINEDNTRFSSGTLEEKVLAGVFDGVGSSDYGEMASLLSAEILCGYQENLSAYTMNNMYLREVNDRLVFEMKIDECTMYTTMAVLYLEGNCASVYNAGDSRIYLIRDNRIMQITYDHTAKNENDKDVITRYLGMKDIESMKLYYVENIDIKEDDIFLLCSDGLYGMVSNEDICDKICNMHNEKSEAIAESLVSDALAAGGYDNITCVVIKAYS